MIVYRKFTLRISGIKQNSQPQPMKSINSFHCRARQIITKEWIVGYYSFYKGKHYIARSNLTQHDDVEVNFDTVGRPVGMYDISGFPIFEDDIVNCDLDFGNAPNDRINLIRRVVYHNGSFRLHDNHDTLEHAVPIDGFHDIRLIWSMHGCSPFLERELEQLVMMRAETDMFFAERDKALQNKLPPTYHDEYDRVKEFICKKHK